MRDTFGGVIAKVDRDIEQEGFSTIGVFPCKKGDVPYTYTIGFWQTLDKPELLIVGLNNQQAHGILWSAYRRMQAHPEDELADGLELDDVLAGDYTVRLREIPPPRWPLNVARTYYGGEDFPALQLLWPDAGGRFPGEDGYEADRWGDQALPIDEEAP